MIRGLRSGLLALVLALPQALPAQDLAELPLADLQAQADAGGTAAQIALGQRHHDGAGVVQNFAVAAEWYARAAEAGNAEAQNRLGRYYHTGLGVAADPAQARRWLRAAADQGAPEHLHDLAAVLEETAADDAALAEAAALYGQAAEAGHTRSAVSLGMLYQNGRGVAQDFARARALYEGPAAAGDARAQNNLGLLYVRGHGVPQDYDRAAQLFAGAAEQGLRTAMTNLGVMYENGFGVPQSDAEAARLYRLGGAGETREAATFVYDPRLAPPPSEPQEIAALRDAARTGDPVAAFQMGWLLVHREPPGPADWQEAAALFAANAEKGHPASMANLALLYIRGTGVPQDYVLAQMWLALAGSAGFEAALPLGLGLRERMTPDQINEAQARAEARWPGAQDTQ
ncbi:sel1 repeat family protein [Thalassococcus profundi]|uniref:Sel1 repeat family protein n=1 Tax=Thalassococcus profundi TaxID=2282382 RepID=A0A369TGK8_9RHOB|nr:tetratricopeptide repeat protein [Thalassococcus profundi]RDD64398.1 sel1 repeat family protein [Thalassococcus profundi]